jgi:hypothetical protein
LSALLAHGITTWYHMRSGFYGFSHPFANLLTFSFL